jgi:hypothetical protein
MDKYLYNALIEGLKGKISLILDCFDCFSKMQMFGDVHVFKWNQEFLMLGSRRKERGSTDCQRVLTYF